MVVWRVSLATLGVLAIQVGECSILSVFSLRFTERSFVYNLVWACRVLEGGASSSDGRVYKIYSSMWRRRSRWVSECVRILVALTDIEVTTLIFC